VDVDAFESSAASALASGEPRAVDAALDAWTGDLLPDDLYASWTIQPRQRAAMLHRELLRRAGRWAELLTVDSTDEEAHLGVAQDLLAVGDRSGALRQLDVLEQVLRDEMGIGPSPEAYDLRIQALDTPVHAPRPTRPPAPRHAGLARQMKARSSWSATPSRSSAKRPAYTSRVMAAEACPSICWNRQSLQVHSSLPRRLVTAAN
jgi:DNA-binding SARP family transcriptional activator